MNHAIDKNGVFCFTDAYHLNSFSGAVKFLLKKQKRVDLGKLENRLNHSFLKTIFDYRKVRDIPYILFFEKDTAPLESEIILDIY